MACQAAQGVTTWEDKSVPASLGYELLERPIAIFRIAAEAVLPPTASVGEFHAFCAQYGCTTDATYTVVLRGDNTFAYFHFGDAKEVGEFAIVPPDVEARRLDKSHDLLKEKSVALVGCGSLGSKLGIMLARCGVGRFFLVDDDLLMPDNLVRNELDWRDMGCHKADAAARWMQFVNPAVKTSIRLVQLAGLEASGTAETAITSLSECDLVIDATAKPNVLNLVSAIAASAKKPILWAEVFAGGIGGLVARCRPNLEPPPQYMRRAIENWFADQNATPVRATRDYGTGGEGAPLLADDADVSAIAAPAARLAIDTLLARDPSLFPYSAYAIGLAPGSVFSEPFQTFPIDTGAQPVLEPEKTLSADEAKAELHQIIRLFVPK
jgi:molybdopterin/thiamine biosynthesis adenylyltransferase